MKKTSAELNMRARRKAMRLHGTIARDLGVRIVSGRYKPGDLLDNEIEASERLKVSRTAYQERRDQRVALHPDHLSLQP